MDLKEKIIYGVAGAGLAAALAIGSTALGISVHRSSHKEALEKDLEAMEQDIEALKDYRRGLSQSTDTLIGRAESLQREILTLQERTERMVGGPVEGVAGSSTVEGLGDLFPGPGPDGFDVLYEKMLKYIEVALADLTIKDYFSRGAAAEIMEARSSLTGTRSYLRDLKKAVDRERERYQSLSEKVSESREHVQQIREDAKKGTEALDRGREALSGGGGPVPDFPGSPDPGDSEGEKDSAYERIQESLKRSWEYLRQMNENIEEGRKAVREANELLRAGSRGGLSLPDIPIIPQEMLETDDAVLEYRQMLQDYQRVIQYFARLRHHTKEGMEVLEKGLQDLREGKVPHEQSPPSQEQDEEKEEKK